MPKQIHIENLENTGTINFFVGDEGASDKKAVNIPAVTKYSSPLDCVVEMTPWGKEHFKVSASVTNPLIGQRIYQKYLVYADESKARDVLTEIAGIFEFFKDEAEINLKHSSFIIPKMWAKLSGISEDATIKYHDTDDASIRQRFDNSLFSDVGLDTPQPHGWVGEEGQLPAHTKGVAPNIAEIVGVPRSPKMGGLKTGLVLYSKKAAGLIKRGVKSSS